MTNNDNQYYIRIHSFNNEGKRTTQLVPATEEQFRNYYRDTDTYRKNQQRHGCCICPAKKKLDCDTDCFNCPYHVSDSLSLDAPLNEEEDSTWHDVTPNGEELIDEVAENCDELYRLMLRLEELMPEAIEIGRRRLAGEAMVHISEDLGIANSTLRDRLKKVEKALKKDFPEFF